MGLKSDPSHGSMICPASGKERLAKGQAKSLAKRGGDVNLTAYKCRSCKGWHVGNLRRFR